VKAADEGGCGVVGFAASVPVGGRHILEPSIQMHNRGNGKGGGIAAAGFVPEQLGVDREVLRSHCLLQIALLDDDVEGSLESDFVSPHFDVAHREKVAIVADYRDVGLAVRPPEVVRYFVRVKPERLSAFATEHGLEGLEARDIEDEFICQNSFGLNRKYYASMGEKRAFVLSHARDLLIFKIVGYAEQVVQYYGLEDLRAHVWIAHQRYPTKGRVWHPAGSHPFIGMNEALVHNGDFANYSSIVDYLRQHNISSQFLTDTEVSVLLFDLWHRTFRYPVEYVIEAMAPTTELDFDRLPEEKKDVYRAIQTVHMHGSPDGPWFFIIAHSDPGRDRYRLLGITDTSMLRPQVFALQEGEVSVGLVASEKQAIDATLHSLSAEDPRFRLVADRYWNARGGSHTDGGAFIFTIDRCRGDVNLRCCDKFGRPVVCPAGSFDLGAATGQPVEPGTGGPPLGVGVLPGDGREALARVTARVRGWTADDVRRTVASVVQRATDGEDGFEWGLALLMGLNDRRYDCGTMKRSVVLQLVREGIQHVLDRVPALEDDARGTHARRLCWQTRERLRGPSRDETTLVICARDFPGEGEECDARLAAQAYDLGWRRFIVYGLRGQRFTGCGLGPGSEGARIDVFGSSGDYLASGIDGLEVHVHDNAQDQLGQIMKSGKLVVYGDVGQTFMYGAKGGEVYVMGDAAGRPLINAAGNPRVVINGSCLDYLAESFMAGDPHAGGGFVVLNGVEFDDRGRVRGKEAPYPGANLFSLASGGAIFVRDPHGKVVPEQLNGGEFSEFEDRDWQLILPYLKCNEELFGISVEQDLLTVDGERRAPSQVYRKVRAVRLSVLAKEEVPE